MSKVWDGGEGVVMERVGGEWEAVLRQLLKYYDLPGLASA